MLLIDGSYREDGGQIIPTALAHSIFNHLNFFRSNQTMP
jgi:RNA 3'-terminal phosphate cyclase